MVKAMPRGRPSAYSPSYAEGLAVGVLMARNALRSRHVSPYAEGFAVGVATTPFAPAVRPQSYADGLYAEGQRPAVGI
jgi:hypothetical protein